MIIPIIPLRYTNGNEEIDGLFIACGGSPQKKTPGKIRRLLKVLIY